MGFSKLGYENETELNSRFLSKNSFISSVKSIFFVYLTSFELSCLTDLVEKIDSFLQKKFEPCYATKTERIVKSNGLS